MSEKSDDWLIFEEGQYLSERAFLVTATNTHAVRLNETVIEIYTGARGIRHLKGYATLANHLFIELLEESDDIDLILDLAENHKYRLPKPQIRSGKVFAPDVRATLQFFPTKPWNHIPEPGFETYLAQLVFKT